MATSVVLDQGLEKRVNALAKLRERSKGYILRQAVSEYVEQEEKKEAFLNEAYKALQDYEQTGLHVTHDEANEYMTRLENGDEVELPKCHV